MATENPESKRKGGGGKLTRTETVTVRLDPKLRYLAELAARKQRRTVSSFIEWAVEESMKHTYLDSNASIDDMAGSLWDVDEPDRFAKLAFAHEFMLTHEEQVLWKLICENGSFGAVDTMPTAIGPGRCKRAISSLIASESIGKNSVPLPTARKIDPVCRRGKSRVSRPNRQPRLQ
jgi:hypothetical protein